MQQAGGGDQYFGESKSLSRYSSEEEQDVIATWRFWSLETFYEPSDTTTNEVLFYVPVDLYDFIELKVEVNLTKSIDALAPTEWGAYTDGSLIPVLRFKQPGYENNPSLVERFDWNNPEHRDWEIKNGASYNWSVTKLPILATRDVASAAGERAILAE